MHLSFQKQFYAVALVMAIVTILSIAASVLVPLASALLLSFILFPLTQKLEKWGLNGILGAATSIILVFLALGGVVFFFSTQISQLSVAFSDFKEKIAVLLTDVIVYANKNASFLGELSREQVLSQLRGWMQRSAGSLVGQTFSSTASFLAGFFATIIYTFLFLIYRRGLTNAISMFATEPNRPRVRIMLRSVQRVGQKYLSGMMILILVIGLANSIGLWIIGIDSPFLFGFLGATLSIIPYVGTVFGAIIPVLYAFMSSEALWIPFAVILLFWAVQLISDNFLSPYIVGSSLNVNALVSILSLIAGAAIWGVAGMILFLPFAAMLKVFCEEFDELKPIALMIGIQEDTEKAKKTTEILEEFSEE